MLKNKRQLMLLSIPIIGMIIVLEVAFLTQNLTTPEIAVEKPDTPQEQQSAVSETYLSKKQPLAQETLYNDALSQEDDEPSSRDTAPATQEDAPSQIPDNQLSPEMGDTVQPSNYDSEEERAPDSQEVVYTQPPPEVLKAREEEAQMSDEERQEKKRQERIEAAQRIYVGLGQRIAAMKKSIKLAEEQGPGVTIAVDEAKKLLERTIEFKKKFEEKIKELKIEIPASENPLETSTDSGSDEVRSSAAAKNAPNAIPNTDGP